MKIRSAVLLSLATGLSATDLQAQTIEPGLWEVDTRRVQMNGQTLPDPQDMLANMPPAQRELIEGMLQERGIAVAEEGVRVCLTEEQVQADQLPLHNLRQDCTEEITERTDQRWRFRFSCPDAQGEGEVRFLSSREFLTRLESTFVVGGEREQGSMETHANWIRADCGNVPPLH